MTRGKIRDQIILELQLDAIVKLEESLGYSRAQIVRHVRTIVAANAVASFLRMGQPSKAALFAPRF